MKDKPNFLVPNFRAYNHRRSKLGPNGLAESEEDRLSSMDRMAVTTSSDSAKPDNTTVLSPSDMPAPASSGE